MFSLFSLSHIWLYSDVIFKCWVLQGTEEKKTQYGGEMNYVFKVLKTFKTKDKIINVIK